MKTFPKLSTLAVSVCVLLLGAAVSVSYGQPIPLYPVCLDPTDKTQRTIQRALCDQNAEDLEYQQGILRPCTPEDTTCGACKSGTPHLCLGAPLQRKAILD